jgi:hypothetical protein
MRSEGLQVEMAKERVKEGVEGAFIPPYPEYSRYSFKTRSIRGKPGNFEKSGDSRETRILWLPKVSTQEEIPVNVLVQRCLS